MIALIREAGYDAPVYLHGAISADASRVAVVTRDRSGNGKINVCDVATGKSILRLNENPRVPHIAFSRDGKWVALVSLGKTTKIWDVDSGKAIVTFQGQMGSAGSAAFSPDGKHLAFGDSKTVKIAKRL